MDFRKILEAHAASRADITVAATPVTAQRRQRVRHPADRRLRHRHRLRREAARRQTLDRLALSEQTLAARGVADRPPLPRLDGHLRLPAGGPDPGARGSRRRSTSARKSSRRPSHSSACTRTSSPATGRTSARSAPSTRPTSIWPRRIRPSTCSASARRSTRARAFCRARSMQRVRLEDSIVCEGCACEDAEIDHSIIGIRSIIGRGVRLSHTVMMGADFYEAGRASSIAGSEAHPRRHRRRQLDRARHHRQERAHRRGRQHPQRGRRPTPRRPGLLHPRRHRHRSEERRHPGGHGHLTDAWLRADTITADLHRDATGLRHPI